MEIPHLEPVAPQLVLLQVLQERVMLLRAHGPFFPADTPNPVFDVRDGGIFEIDDPTGREREPSVVVGGFEARHVEVGGAVPVRELGGSPRCCWSVGFAMCKFGEVGVEGTEVVVEPGQRELSTCQ